MARPEQGSVIPVGRTRKQTNPTTVGEYVAPQIKSEPEQQSFEIFDELITGLTGKALTQYYGRPPTDAGVTAEKGRIAEELLVAQAHWDNEAQKLAQNYMEEFKEQNLTMDEALVMGQSDIMRMTEKLTRTKEFNQTTMKDEFVGLKIDQMNQVSVAHFLSTIDDPLGTTARARQYKFDNPQIHMGNYEKIINQVNKYAFEAENAQWEGWQQQAREDYRRVSRHIKEKNNQYVEPKTLQEEGTLVFGIDAGVKARKEDRVEESVVSVLFDNESVEALQEQAYDKDNGYYL